MMIKTLFSLFDIPLTNVPLHEKKIIIIIPLILVNNILLCRKVLIDFGQILEGKTL